MTSIRQLAMEFIQEHPETKDEILKAYYAYHAGHARLTPRGHNFSNGSRGSKCFWCGRSREMVRWDDITPYCLARPELDDIADVILKEEIRANELITQGERLIRKTLGKQGLSGKTLAILHHTHGYSPETVSAVVDIPVEVMQSYEAEMELERQKSVEAYKPTVISVVN